MSWRRRARARVRAGASDLCAYAREVGPARALFCRYFASLRLAYVREDAMVLRRRWRRGIQASSVAKAVFISRCFRAMIYVAATIVRRREELRTEP